MKVIFSGIPDSILEVITQLRRGISTKIEDKRKMRALESTVEVVTQLRERLLPKWRLNVR